MVAASPAKKQTTDCHNYHTITVTLLLL